MREIKFRGWSEGVKKMTYFGDGTGWITNSEMKDGDTWGMFFKALGSVYLTGYQAVMQFTGLKDKNGREIYEGDICEDARSFRFVVVWDDDNARFLGRGIGKQKEYIRYVGQEPSVEVIGNIYDNPELLEG